MPNYRYQQNADPQARYTRLSLQLDNGLSALLELGKTYTLTSGEAQRASQYILLVASSDPVTVPFQKMDIPVVGPLNDGDYIAWDVASRAFVPTAVAGGGGGVVGPIQESDLDPTLAAKIDAVRGFAPPINLGSVGTNQTITLTSDLNLQILDVKLTLTGSITLTIAALSAVTFIIIRVFAKQDAVGGRALIIKESVSGQTTTITNLDVSANGQTMIECSTDDGTTLNVAQPSAGGGGSSLPAATKTGDRLTLDATNAPAWSSPVAPPSAIDLAPYGNAIFHRGAGQFAEDDSLRAIRVANGVWRSSWAVVDGGDWRLNASGSVVSMHDSTVNRTTTTTGTVSALTDTQWRALQLLARTPAQPTTEGPPFASDVLDYCKKLGLICAPELKVTGNSAFNTQVLGLIQARGMEKQCIVGSAVLGDLAVFKAAGVPTMYIVDATPDTQANILAAAPDFFCYNANRPLTGTVTDAMLQAFHAAGIRVGIWIIDSSQDLASAIAHLDSIGVPCQHYYTNAAPWVSRTGLPPTRTRDPFSQGLFWPGMVQGDSYDSFGMFTKWSRGTFVGSPYRFSLPDADQGSFVIQGWMTPCTSPAGSITLNITFDALGTQSARWAAVVFNCPTDRAYMSGDTTLKNRGEGYLALIRTTGSLELYRSPGDNAASVQLGSSQATAAIIAGQTVTLKIEPNLPGGQMRVTRTDSGGFTPILVTDSTFRGVGNDPRSPYVWLGKRTQTGEGLSVSFSNVVVANPPTFAGIPAPWVTAHRGGGASMAPEEVPEAYAWVLNTADGTATSKNHIFLDGDTQRTSDNVLVMNHDSTVDRTTTSTGNVSSFTLSAFKALTVDPPGNTDFPLAGWANDNPMSLADFLTTVAAGSQPALIEAKNSADVVTMVSQVQSAGLQNKVIIAVDTSTDVAAVKAAGIQCMLVGVSTTPSSDVISSSPQHFAYAYTLTSQYTDTYLQTLANSGVKNWYYTLRRRSDHDHEMTRPGVVGGASDDPFYVLRQNVIENSLDLTTNSRYHHGMIESNATKQAGKRPTISGGKLVFAAPSTASQWMLLGSLADESQGCPTRINFTVTWDALGTDTARWFAFIFGCPDDSSWYFDTANADNQGTGYLCAMRQTGQLLISRQNAGAAATSLAAPAAANPVTVAGTSINFQIDYNKTTHVITLTRLDTNAVATGTADATYQGAYMHCGQNSQSTGQHVSFSNIAVTR